MEGSRFSILLITLLALVTTRCASSLLSLPTQQRDVLGISHDPNEIRFYLYYSPSNLTLREEVIFNDTSSLKKSHFQIGRKTVLIIHGFVSNAESHLPTTLKNAYLASSLNYNYIVVDWGKLATSDNSVDNTLSPVPYTDIVLVNIPIVARRVADFLNFLDENDYAHLDSIHLVGHSLGAHVSGNAGNFINLDNRGARISRISGLDPAGPGFFVVQVQRSLQPGDADFVDVYHTAMGTAGTIYPVGDVDFYPNGGVIQPGCNGVNLTSLNGVITTVNVYGTAACSHEFVGNFYAATITKNFTACQCDPFTSELNILSKCLKDCPNPALAGEPCVTSTTGQYYLETSSNP